MKKMILAAAGLCAAMTLHAQNYPDPEFANEVYCLKKDSGALVRLEKETAKMESSGGAFKGFESGYSLEGEKSPVRFTKSSGLSFIFSTGRSSGFSSHADSSKANSGSSSLSDMMSGIDDPSNRITLYKTDGGKGKRKVILQKGGGIGGKKLQSSDKYSFSVKKIRNGYWELIIDKPLPKGEYAFSTMTMGMGGMDGSTTFYAFGID
jgi:hypothetical protein